MSMYSIGELARLTGLSPKTLRYYEQEQLLQPEIRNAANGYRFYSEKQLLQCYLIKELQDFGLCLKEIQSVLVKQDHHYLAEQLQQKAKALQEEADALNRRLASVRFALRRLAAASQKLEREESQIDPAYQVELFDFPSTQVLFTRYESHINAAQLFSERAAELQALRRQYGLFATGPMLGIFHDGYARQFTEERGDLELCLPVSLPKGQRFAEVKQLPPCLCASTIHVGHYSYAYRAYLLLLEWIEASPYQIAGPPMEMYLLDPGFTTDETLYVTRICFPLAKTT